MKQRSALRNVPSSYQVCCCITLQEMCAQYWPKEPSTAETRGAVSIELLSEETFDDYIHREIKLDETVKV